MNFSIISAVNFLNESFSKLNRLGALFFPSIVLESFVFISDPVSTSSVLSPSLVSRAPVSVLILDEVSSFRDVRLDSSSVLVFRLDEDLVTDSDEDDLVDEVDGETVRGLISVLSWPSWSVLFLN